MPLPHSTRWGSNQRTACVANPTVSSVSDENAVIDEAATCLPRTIASLF